jgi:hypothetical protein
LTLKAVLHRPSINEFVLPPVLTTTLNTPPLLVVGSTLTTDVSWTRKLFTGFASAGTS